MFGGRVCAVGAGATYDRPTMATTEAVSAKAASRTRVSSLEFSRSAHSAVSRCLKRNRRRGEGEKTE